MAFAGQGSTLQTHNVELVKCIEDLREKREEVHRQLMEEESERQKLTSELQLIQRRLNQINESITRKSATRNEYDKVVQETEAAYMKLLESSSTLLTVLKRESVNIQSKNSLHSKRQVLGVA